MSGNGTAPTKIEREIEETIHHRDMGVKVEKVVERVGINEKRYLKVYKRKSGRFASLEGDGVNETEWWHQIGKFEPQEATETLFGLAEAHGYELVSK